ncbi:MAG: extracellular solute-binding protein [Thermoproteus sp.]
MKRTTALIVAAVIAAILGVGVYVFSNYGRGGSGAPSQPSGNRSLVLCIAGAYAAEGHYLAEAYRNITGVQVVVKPGGSFALAHQIALGVPCDVFMPVAFRQAVAGTGAYDPGWAIAFVADSNVIVYSNASLKTFPGMAELLDLYREAYTSNDSKLWYRFFYELTSGKYPLGVADPATDPEGLYAMLIFEAAGELYAGNESFFIYRMAENRANVTRSSTFYYVVPLKEGQLAFVFSYKSYAEANGLQYLELPPWLNFGDAAHSGWYSRFSWTIPIEGVETQIRGSPVYLYITIPRNARDRTAALDFLLFVLRERGQLARYGLTPLGKPVVFGNASSLPAALRQLLSNGTLTYGGPLT